MLGPLEAKVNPVNGVSKEDFNYNEDRMASGTPAREI
jgi:hypothetical protein